MEREAIVNENFNLHLPEYRGVRVDSGEYGDWKAKSCTQISTARGEMQDGGEVMER
jgi:hypothetical protein